MSIKHGKPLPNISKGQKSFITEGAWSSFSYIIHIDKRMSIESRKEEGGTIPDYACLQPNHYYFDTLARRYKKRNIYKTQSKNKNENLV